MKRTILVSVLMSVTGLSSSFAASSADKSLALANCPNDYYGEYAISPIITNMDYVTIETSETNQMVIEFAGDECIATVNGGAGITNPDANGNVQHVSCSISCDSDGVLDLNIGGVQHNFSKKGTDLVVDGKTYPVAENQ